jgi:hypothetical protein
MANPPVFIKNISQEGAQSALLQTKAGKSGKKHEAVAQADRKDFRISRSPEQ